LLGRTTVALLGAAAAATVALAGASWGSRWRLPLVMGFLAAVVPVHVRFSCVLSPEVPAGLGLSLMLLAALHIAVRGFSWARAIAGGLSLALAAAFHPMAVLGVVALLTAILSAPGGWPARALRAALALALALGGALVLWPEVLRVFWEGEGGGSAVWLPASNPTASFLEGLPELIRPALLGPAVILLALAVVPLALWRGASASVRRSAALLLAGRGATALALVARGELVDRGALWLVPYLLLLVGTSLQAIRERLGLGWLRHSVAVMAFLAILPTSYAGAVTAHSLLTPRTETEVYRWFIQNVPAGARVLRDVDGPQLPPQRYQVEVVDLRQAPPAQVEDPDFVVLRGPVVSALRAHAGTVLDDVARNYARYLSGAPCLRVCPEHRRLGGPELWVFATSQRAEALAGGAESIGDCQVLEVVP
jgi:hypothetical protein